MYVEFLVTLMVLLEVFWVAFTAWKLSIFGVILVRIFPHLDWLQTRITPNTDNFYAVIADEISDGAFGNSKYTADRSRMVFDNANGNGVSEGTKLLTYSYT